MYDVIIIGGGIAGLYSAYKITKMSPESKILVLEKSNRQNLGGRMGNRQFHGVSLAIAAGIGRKEKDFRLMDLLDELKIKYGEFPVTPNYSLAMNHPCELKKIFLNLKRIYNPLKDKNKTFKEFALTILKPDEYKHFTMCSGYTDYEEESAYDTLYHYGFDDNYANWTGLGIHWNTLIEKLVNEIGEKNIQCSQEVAKIRCHEDLNGFTLLTKDKKEYVTRKVILATTIDSVQQLVPGGKRPDSIYKDIKGQTFIRIYGQFDKYSIPLMKTFVSKTTVVSGPLHKIIPMDSEKGVYMIAYSDNAAADKLNKYSENTEANREILCRLIEKSIGMAHGAITLNEITTYYWKIGTHYYKPLKNEYKNRGEFIKMAQHPMTNMLVVGEAVCKSQGWVEGALESVDTALTKKWVS